MNKTPSSTERWWDLPAAMLLLAALVTAATRLVATRWTSNLDIVQTLAIFGVLAGLALGISRFSPRWVGLLASVYGAFAITWQLGLTVKNVHLWTDRLLILLQRLGMVLYQLVNRERVSDSLLFVVLMCILFWVLAVHAAYTLVRYGSTWKIILPAGLALFVIHSFDPLVSRRAWYLAMYLFFALVLVARVVFIHNRNQWQKSHTALPPHLGLDFIRFTITAVAIIVIFAWTAPALASTLPVAQRAWQPIQERWSRVRNYFENAFASLQPTVGILSGFYGSNVSLGRGNSLSDAQVFAVNPPENIPPTIRMYWRARTYDTYENGQWLSQVSMARLFNPQQESQGLPLSEQTGRILGTFEFIPAQQVSTLFTAPQPVWVDKSAQIDYLANPDGSVDISTIRALPSLDRGDIYQVRAYVNNATVKQLKEAGTDYPLWVTQRYVQLPTSITLRTRQLAQDITKDLVTPYDKAVAITQYLRDHITYVENITEELPRQQDTVDWFLFDLKKGFCNYYSTAEIVLLRSIGIPARWAIGFAQGEINSDGNYIVLQRDAHSWPEVYFPGVGWVEFEPTVSQPDIGRPSGDTANSATPGSPNPNDLSEIERRQQLRQKYLEEKDQLPPTAQPQQSRSNVVYWIVPLGLGLGSVLVWLFWRFRAHINLQKTPVLLEITLIKIGFQPPRAIQLWARRSVLPPLTRAYMEINHALIRLGKRPAITDTPAERATNLGGFLPPANTPACQLVNEYQGEIFGKQPANLETASKAASEIRKLSFKASIMAFLQRLLTRLQQPGSEKRPI